MLFKLINVSDKFKCKHQHRVVNSTILQHIGNRLVLHKRSIFCILDPSKASTTICWDWKIKFEGVEAITTWGGLRVNAISWRDKSTLFLLFCGIGVDGGGSNNGTTIVSGTECIGVACAFRLRLPPLSTRYCSYEAFPPLVVIYPLTT